MARAICILRGAALVVGDLDNLAKHTSLCAVNSIGLTADIKKKIPGQEKLLQAKSFVFDGSLTHETFFNGPVGVFFAEPGTSIGELFVKQAGPDRITDTPPWQDEFADICSKILNLATPDGFSDIIHSAYPFNELMPTGEIQTDSRIIRVLQTIVGGDEPCDVQSLADSIGMSPSWLQHNFKELVGVPILSSRRWFRLKSTVLAIKKGYKVSEAAVLGGFYDQAHFTNTFSKTFGVSPASVFAGGEEVKWYVEEDPYSY